MEKNISKGAPKYNYECEDRMANCFQTQNLASLRLVCGAYIAWEVSQFNNETRGFYFARCLPECPTHVVTLGDQVSTRISSKIPYFRRDSDK